MYKLANLLCLIGDVRLRIIKKLLLTSRNMRDMEADAIVKYNNHLMRTIDYESAWAVYTESKNYIEGLYKKAP